MASRCPGVPFFLVCALGIFSPAARSTLQDAHAIPVQPGWNLLSLPLRVEGGDRDSLFPSGISPAYGFSGSGGYQPLDTLEDGIGFWLKFASAGTVPVEGTFLFSDTIPVRAGWNLIGSLSLPVPADSVRNRTPGLTLSEFFRYVAGAGYEEADTLLPGHGHWVKASSGGALMLRSPDGLPCPGGASVDYGGKVYHTVQVGTQCWLREHLDVGAMIAGSLEQTDNDTIQKYCYDDNPADCAAYGGLYQWNEAMQYDTSEGVRGVCPAGWHLPTAAEFQTLAAAAGGDANALKRQDQGSGPGRGTNTTGFSALLTGARSFTGTFLNLGLYGVLWTSTRSIPGYARGIGLHHDDAVIYPGDGDRRIGFTLRCIRD
ncbi:MAG: FISUMP domain-containing protein [Bacteroidota bacterium]